MLEETALSPLFDRRSLIRLILPLVVEQLLAVTIGMADTMMVTVAGDAAVSGISLVDSINLLLIQVFAALATGGAVLASQYLGHQEEEQGRSAAKQLIHISFLSAFVLMALCLCLRRQILSLIFGNIEPAVMEAGLVYFKLTALSFPFLALYNAGAALFRSMGNSKVSMFTSLLMNVVNFVGNAILIYGFGWGERGAGTATLVSRALGAIIMIALICRKTYPLHVEGLFHLEFRGGILLGILKVGVPSGIENGMFHIGKLMVARLVTSFGTAAVTANAVSNSVAGLANVSGNALGLAMITVVGQCMGARAPDQAVHYTKKLMSLAYLCNGIMCLILFFTAKPLMYSGLFKELSPETYAMATQVLQSYAIACILIWPMSFTLPNCLRAAGDAKFTMVISLMSMWIFRIGCSYLLAYAFDITLMSAWLGMYLDWVVRAIFFLVRFLQGHWKTIRLI